MSICWPTSWRMRRSSRQAVLTGVNQMAAQVSLANAQQLGCDLVETTAHQGARPDHTVWQGKIFSISGRHPKYPQLSKATGYGTGDGLCGWNCRHSFYPYFEGLSVPAYTKETLDEMAAATVFFNGEELTQYDASQKQRYIERKIRKWKREYLAMEAAGQDTGEAAVKLKEWRVVQADFCRQTGLRADGFRGQVHGFGRSQASKATWAAREIEKRRKDDILIEKLRSAGRLPKTAKIHLTPTDIDVESLSFDDEHINKERKHRVTHQQAKMWILEAAISVTVWGGRFERYYGTEGAVYVNLEKNEIRTAYGKAEFDRNTAALIEEVIRNGISRKR